MVPQGVVFAPVEASEFVAPWVANHRLTLAGRQVIQLGRSMALSIRAIAAGLGVAASTVSREIKENGFAGYGGWKYDARVAEKRSAARRLRGKTPKLQANGALRAQVVRMLNEKFSPQEIAGRLPLEFPDDESMRVSHETIYQALYLTGRGSLRHELVVSKALRSGRSGRKPRSKLPPRSGRPWLEGHRLTDRSAEQVEEIAGRLVPGHWEGDLVIGIIDSDPGQDYSPGILTLVERTTRFTLVGRLPGNRSAGTINNVLTNLITSLPERVWRSLTWDQGIEMARHKELTTFPAISPDLGLWFCDPHSPWQRPSNENTNGLLRDYWPKGTDFTYVPDEEIARVNQQLNDRPRRVLGFYTPQEKMTELLTGVAPRP